MTHPHLECVQGSAFLNLAIVQLIAATSPEEANDCAPGRVDRPHEAWASIEQAPHRSRQELANSGWVRDTVESAIWGLCSTGSFEGAVVQVVSLGNDADTSGTVVGALAGAAHG